MAGTVAADPPRLRPVGALPDPTSPPPAAVAGAQPDDWPHTTRPLPWLIAGLLTMFWMVPFDAIDLPIQLPFDTKLDRFVLAATAMAWLLAVLLGREYAPRLRRSPVNVAVMAFAGVAFVSVLLNVEVLANLGQFGLAMKKLVLLSSFLVLFVIVSTSVRRSELHAYTVLLMGLAAVSAIAVIYEYRTGTNVFYDWSARLLPDSVSVGFPPADSKFGRESVVGPTGHGLAIATLFAMTLPFAVVSVLNASDRRSKLFAFAVVGLLVAGSVSTLRKTGAVAPAAALLVLLSYRPRAMLRLVPAGLALLVAIQVAAPGAITRVKAQLVGGDVTTSSSSQGRTADYDAVLPDILAHPVVGRGFGTYDSAKFRILDNDYLGITIETGLLGLALFLALIGSVVLACHSVIRSREQSVRSATAFAAAAAAVSFGTATALFDVLSFPHAPYVFFFVAGLAVVATGRLAGAAPDRPATEPSRSAA